jgi:hypothetical protein
MTESSNSTFFPLESNSTHETENGTSSINRILTERSPLLAVAEEGEDPRTDSTTSDFHPKFQRLHARTQEAPKKNIGTIDSFVYILIQMYGYGVLALPVLYQQGSLTLI